MGPGQFQRRIEEFYLDEWGKRAGNSKDVEAYDLTFDEPGSQCLYEVTACEGGALGLLALACFLAAALARGFRSGDAGGPDVSRPALGPPIGFRAGALGAAAGVLVAGLFSSVMVRGVALPFVMVLALGARRRNTKSEPDT